MTVKFFHLYNLGWENFLLNKWIILHVGIKLKLKIVQIDTP